MDYETLRCERDGHVTVLTYDRPEQRTAVSRQMNGSSTTPGSDSATGPKRRPNLRGAASAGGREHALDVRPKGLARDRCSRLQGRPHPGVAASRPVDRASDGARLPAMCRNIRQLHNFDPPATEEEVQDAALQYVRKISGSNKPSK